MSQNTDPGYHNSGIRKAFTRRRTSTVDTNELPLPAATQSLVPSPISDTQRKSCGVSPKIGGDSDENEPKITFHEIAPTSSENNPNLPTSAPLGRARGARVRSVTMSLKTVGPTVTTSSFPAQSRRRLSGQSTATSASSSLMTPVRKARTSISKKLASLGGKGDTHTLAQLLSVWEMEGKLAGKCSPDGLDKAMVSAVSTPTDTVNPDNSMSIIPGNTKICPKKSTELSQPVRLSDLYDSALFAVLQTYYASHLDECFKNWSDDKKKDKEKKSDNTSLPEQQVLEEKKFVIRKGVPVVVQDCQNFLEADQERLYEPGLFRKSCNGNRMRELAAGINQGERLADLWEKSPLYTVHEITGLYKSYFRLSTEPLLTSRLINAFIHVDTFGGSLNLQKMLLHRLIAMLPIPNQQLLYSLLTFFKRVSTFEMRKDAEGNLSDGNMMSTKNLAIVMGPNIMRTTSLKVETHDAVNNVTDLLIQHCEELFMVPTTTLERINGAVSTHNQTELKHTATLSQAQGV